MSRKFQAKECRAAKIKTALIPMLLTPKGELIPDEKSVKGLENEASDKEFEDAELNEDGENAKDAGPVNKPVYVFDGRLFKSKPTEPHFDFFSEVFLSLRC